MSLRIIITLLTGGESGQSSEQPGSGVYYVSPNGTGSGTGSAEAPISWSVFKNRTLAGGDTIYLEKGGIYRGTIRMKGGSSINAFGSGVNPVIRGTVASSSLSWVQNGSVWVANSTERVSRIFRDGSIERIAQSALYTITSKPNTTTIVATGAKSLSNVTEMEMVSKEWPFRWKYNKILAYNATTGSFTVDYENNAGVGFGFRLMNHPNLIVDEGDWAWVNGVVYYKSPGNVNPGSLNIELSVVEEGVVLETNSADYSIQNVDFFGQALDGVFGINISNLTIDNCNFSGQFANGIALMGSSANHTITDVNIENCGANGIISTQNNVYEYGRINITGIGMAANWPFLRDSSGVRYEWPHFMSVGNGIATIPVGLTGQGWVHDCNVHDVAYIGISARQSDTIIEKNHVWNYCKRASDGSGIYQGSHEAYYGTDTYGSNHGWKNIKNTIIRNNWVHDGFGSMEGVGPAYGTTPHVEGIYCDNGEEDVQVLNNTCYNNQGAGILINFYTRRMITRNNVCYNNDYQIWLGNFTGDGQFLAESQVVENNVLVNLHPAQRCIRIYDSDPTDFNPFANGGNCEGNTLVSPYSTTPIRRQVQGTVTNYTLAQAVSKYGEPFGVVDSYTGTYVSIDDAMTKVILITNETTGTVSQSAPTGFRALSGEANPVTLGAYESAVYVKTS